MAESREAKITRGTSVRLHDDSRCVIRPSTVRRFGALCDALSPEVAIDRGVRPIIWPLHITGFVADQIYRCFLQGYSRGKSLPVGLVKRFREKPPDLVVCLPLRSENTVVAPAAAAPHGRCGARSSQRRRPAEVCLPQHPESAPTPPFRSTRST